ncbi:MAG TPA: prepilin-type N-terminal cleavage/methylation domain-containing protein [Tepidisphaeraceae bacterium]|jgi:hypothetical protein|nr:prepilin-type N-terminal cleavage/methylation domain-containing protein [Tepidisphaeraceae bacterium]
MDLRFTICDLRAGHRGGSNRLEEVPDLDRASRITNHVSPLTHRTKKSQIANRKSAFAFTILEVMIAIFIFALVLTAVYATWMSILRGTKAGLAAAAEVQRSRRAVRTIEEALVTAQMFNENIRYYSFIADNSRDFAYLSMVSRLPGDFPGVGRYGRGDLVVRRVTFSVEDGKDGSELVMTQAPMLMATNEPGVHPYSLVLAKDISQFGLEFWDQNKRDWSDEWQYTNWLPRLVRLTIGFGHKKGGSDPHDTVTRIVALPAGGLGMPGMPAVPPGMPPGGGPFPGGGPLPGRGGKTIPSPLINR